MVKAVLFDLDGTLVNSLEDLADSTNYALNKFGLPTHETRKFKYFVGDGMKKLIERVLPEDKRDEETFSLVFDAFFGYYKVHFADKTCVYEGMAEVLSQLKDKGMKLAVISNKADEMAVTVTEKNFGKIFDIVSGKREEYPTKPNPELTLKIIRELGVSPNECVLIGDSGMDAKTAVNAGCTGIGVLWGFRTEEELRLNGDRYIAKEPEDILTIIEEINNVI